MPGDSIPLVDLYAQYLSIREPIDAAIRRVIESSAYVGGTPVRDFEAAYSSDYGGVIACRWQTAPMPSMSF